MTTVRIITRFKRNYCKKIVKRNTKSSGENLKKDRVKIVQYSSNIPISMDLSTNPSRNSREKTAR